MIIEFSIKNFRSFKDLETLSLMAAPLKSANSDVDINNIIKVNKKLSLLRSKAIYGANASGKSNIIRAFTAFKRLTRLSINDDAVVKEVYDDFILDGNFHKTPVFYQLVFIYENIIYRYGFEVIVNAIVNEWLFKKNSAKKETELFIREGMKVSVNAVHFNEAKRFDNLLQSGDSDIFQAHTLFLSATAAVGVKLSKDLQQFINNTGVANSTDGGLRQYSTNWWMSKENMKRGIGLLQAADTGVQEISTTDYDVNRNNHNGMNQLLAELNIPKNIKRLTSIKQVYRKGKYIDTKIETLFDSFESEGTIRFSLLIPIILDALENGNALWIDEFDASLHPRLTRKIVSLFHSTSTNPHGAQLIFATHDTNLLKSSFLRQDQICFVEKDKAGISHIKTLIEYKGVSENTSYDRDYIQGKYGAVPFLNQLDNAVEKGISKHE